MQVQNTASGFIFGKVFGLAGTKPVRDQNELFGGVSAEKDLCETVFVFKQ
jgi:hypothetical protein